jgi:plasmid segregation protein ParM
MTFVIGLDHGNGWVKIRTATNEIVLPSFLGREDEIGDNVTANASSLDVKKYEIPSVKGSAFVWGEDVTKLKHVVATYGVQNRYAQETYQALSKFALAEALPEGIVFDDVLVVTGVPSIEVGSEKEKQLREVFEGAHHVRINGRDKIINVTRVVVISQPLGAVLSRYLDDEGFVANEKYESESVAVIDIGTGTTDLDHIKALRRISADCHSIPVGMFDVYKRIAAWVNKQNPNANATPQEVEKQFKNDYYEVSKRIRYDIREIKEVALKEVADEIITAISQHWKSFDIFDEVLINGGGANELGKKIQTLVQGSIILKNSQTANAEGFFKYGQFLKEAKK